MLETRYTIYARNVSSQLGKKANLYYVFGNTQQFVTHLWQSNWVRLVAYGILWGW